MNPAPRAAAFTVALADATLHGDTRGDRAAGVTTVFLHGFGGDGGDWDAVWARLPATMPLLRYDQRGFGASDGLAVPGYSHAGDLLGVLDARGLTRVNLVGVSQGGAIAIQVAIAHPARIARLALVSPALAGWQWSAAWRDAWRAAAGPARAGDIDAARAAWWHHPMFAPTRAGPAAARLRASIDGFAGHQWRRDPQSPTPGDVDRLVRLVMPVLLLSGRDDIADFHGIADVLAANAPAIARIHYDAGHMLHFDRPVEIAAALTRFLA